MVLHLSQAEAPGLCACGLGA